MSLTTGCAANLIAIQGYYLFGYACFVKHFDNNLHQIELFNLVLLGPECVYVNIMYLYAFKLHSFLNSTNWLHWFTLYYY